MRSDAFGAFTIYKPFSTNPYRWGACEDVWVSIATRLSGDRAEIEITDTGCGIPEEHFSKILEPLFSTKSFGTGLGLPTVKRIMEDHNGDLEISDRNDRGARAVLWLPLVFGEE